jgi:hypothetical protein
MNRRDRIAEKVMKHKKRDEALMKRYNESKIN